MVKGLKRFMSLIISALSACLLPEEACECCWVVARNAIGGLVPHVAPSPVLPLLPVLSVNRDEAKLGSTHNALVEQPFAYQCDVPLLGK